MRFGAQNGDHFAFRTLIRSYFVESFLTGQRGSPFSVNAPLAISRFSAFAGEFVFRRFWIFRRNVSTSSAVIVLNEASFIASFPPWNKPRT
jgi:hypothetical protein